MLEPRDECESGETESPLKPLLPPSGPEALVAALHRELHALCQPLTALQCRLELGCMLGDAAGWHEAVMGGLEETRRMFASVASMREALCLQEQLLKSASDGRADGDFAQEESR